jgi:hypothetical protein
MGNRWILPRKLLDDRQGKFSSLDMDISNSGSDNEYFLALTTTTKTIGGKAGHKLLLPPIIESTRSIAMEETTKILRKQNKIHRNEALLHQAIKTQWITHHSKTLLQSDHWEDRTKTLAHSEMAPQGLALQHEAAQLLKDCKKIVCPTRRRWEWN